VAFGIERLLAPQGEHLGRLPDVAPAQRAIVTSVTGPMAGRTPRYLRTLLTFPYADGLGFVHAWRRRHPWTEVKRLYRDPPRSTAQILHPERYLDRREDPVAVSLPDLAPLLGPGARRVVEDDAGEFALREVLQEFLGDGASAAGWRGDRYALWDDAAGGPVLLAVTVWESEPAADAFAAAYRRLLAAKHSLGPASRHDPGVALWEVTGRAFAVERRGAAVLLVEGAQITGFDALRAAVWAVVSARPPG
jgi:hypothetical protein